MKNILQRIDYFINPVQVQFFYEEEWNLGIAYRDEIISCVTGKNIPIIQILINNSREEYPIIIYESWIEMYI